MCVAKMVIKAPKTSVDCKPSIVYIIPQIWNDDGKRREQNTIDALPSDFRKEKKIINESKRVEPKRTGMSIDLIIPN